MVTQNRNNDAEKALLYAADCKRLTCAGRGQHVWNPAKTAILWETRRRRTKAYLRLRQTLRRRRSQHHGGTTRYRLRGILPYARRWTQPPRSGYLDFHPQIIELLRTCTRHLHPRAPIRKFLRRLVVAGEHRKPQIVGIPAFSQSSGRTCTPPGLDISPYSSAKTSY